MPFHLICELDDLRRRFQLGDAENQYVLGSAADCELHLPFPTVSRHHARLHVAADGIHIEDLGSSNGSFVDGQRLAGRFRISADSRIRFGSITARLQPIAADDASLAVALRMSRHDGNQAIQNTLPSMRSDGLGGAAWERLIASLARAESLLARSGHVGDALLGSGLADSVEIIDCRSGDGDDARILLRQGDPAASSTCHVEHGTLRLHASGERLDPALLRALLRLLAFGPEPATPPSDAAHVSTMADDDCGLADARMREIYRRARRVASSDLNVLIRGESGTGKEVFAQFIRQHAGDARPYVALNCAALAPDLIDAELFGIERGVATGVEARPGKFEQAHGGIVFLDEIGDMSPPTQARLLRVLQEGEATRIGGSRPRPAQVRVIAATNQDIDTAVAEGRFRLDLLHRIADWQVTLPPLRERPQDIALLAGRFLEQACRARGIRISGITRAAHAALIAHDWPGNVRELQREMARAAVFLSNDDALSQLDLSVALRRDPTESGKDLTSQLEAAERRILRTAIAVADGNMSDAATRLGIARSTLYRRMEALGLRERDAD
ncbi:MAG: sigma 54-interacting transcriptional regulator [Lysobacteraceae bacterium]